MMVINLRFVCQPQRGYTWPNEWSQCNKNVLWMNEGESVFFFSTSWWQLRTIFKKKTERLINPAFFFLSLWFRWDDLKHQSTVRENNKRLKKKKKSLTLRETMKAAQANHCRAHRLASFHWSAEKSWGTRLVLPHWSSACWSVWTSSGSGLKKKKSGTLFGSGWRPIKCLPTARKIFCTKRRGEPDPSWRRTRSISRRRSLSSWTRLKYLIWSSEFVTPGIYCFCCCS